MPAQSDQSAKIGRNDRPGAIGTVLADDRHETLQSRRISTAHKFSFL